MKKLLYIVCLWYPVLMAGAQNPTDTVSPYPAKTVVDTPVMKPLVTAAERQQPGAGDDPSQFITRLEIFNNVQHYDRDADFYVDVTTIRTIVQLGERLTTRLDIPLAYNSLSTPATMKHFGLGDISLRLLGFRIFAKKASAMTASVEFSFNTASSPLLGTGKNLIVPVLTYSANLKNKGIFSAVLQQSVSMWGDRERQNVNVTKLQVILLTFWSGKIWTVLAPELYIDYVHPGTSMNLQGRLVYAPVRQVNLWVQAGSGLYGDFAGRYQWSAELGFRYFIFMKKTGKQRSGK